MKEIGFVGLGAMGSAMAPLLSKANFNVYGYDIKKPKDNNCLLYTSPSPRDTAISRMPSSA